MYAYISSFKRTNTQKEQIKNKGLWGFENSEYWNMQAVYLEPLKDFLQKMYNYIFVISHPSY